MLSARRHRFTPRAVHVGYAADLSDPETGHSTSTSVSADEHYFQQCPICLHLSYAGRTIELSKAAVSEEIISPHPRNYPLKLQC